MLSSGGQLSAYAEERAWVKYDNGTLIFQYSEKEYLGDGEYWLNKGFNMPNWTEQRNSVAEVVFDKSFAQARPTSCYNWFSLCSKLTTIRGVENLNTSNVANMSYMFYNCAALKSLNISNFNTANVVDMSYMFYNCAALKSLNISNFNTANVVDMSHMFTLCQNLTSLDISKFNTANVVDMSYMFDNCHCLKSLELVNFDTSKATYMYNMFSLCTNLTSLDLSNFDTSNITDMSYMFFACWELRTIFASDKFVLASVTNDCYMFSGCKKLVGAIVFDANNVDKTYATIDGGYFTDKKYTRPWVKYTDDTLTFQYGYKKSLGDDEYSLNEGDKTPNWNDKKDNVKKVVFDESFTLARPTSCYDWFSYFSKLTTIEGVENLNTSNVSNMSYMFCDCSSLKSLDLSNFDTSNVTNMLGMFYDCSSLKFLDLSNFNTSNVTNMSGLFFGCSSLTSLNLSNFETSNVTIMDYMFNECSSLTSLNLSNFNTPNVCNMSGLFCFCSSIKSLDVSNFNTLNAGLMCNIFKGCTGLKSIYFGDKFDLATTNDGIFLDCPATLYCTPHKYDSFKNNVIASYTNVVKPYVDINSAAEYGTLCVPIGSTLTESNYSGLDKLYTIKSADKDKGTITMVKATEIEPGVAYVYHRNLPEGDTKSIITFSADMEESTIVTDPKNDDSLLKGTFERITAPGGCYILQTDGNFHPVSADNTTLGVGAYRAYLDLSSLPGFDNTGDVEAKAYKMVFEDNSATAIDGVSEQPNNQPKTYFDLMGRRVSTPKVGGLYIVNGKKVMYKN